MAPRHRRARPRRRYGYWYLVRRVPREFSAYDTRNPVMLSTGIRVADDPRALVATAAVQKLDDGLERYWHERRGGGTPMRSRATDNRSKSGARLVSPTCPAS